jgi:hypothetical protein
MSEIEQMQAVLADAIDGFGRSSERTVQSREGRIGPSDLGFCRNKAALMTRGIEQSDVTPLNAAQIGTAIHAYVAQAFEWANPDNWLVERKVTARFPSGVEITGTADLIMTDWNACIDVKTVDGFSWIKREGVSQNHKFQRHTYTIGAIAEGLLDEDRTIYVGNLYIDRSGKEKTPLLILEEYDPSLTDQVDSWIGDVIYAVKNDEEASRDIPAPVCAQICEYFTVCRGDLPVHEGAETIEDETRVTAIRLYNEGKAMAKEGEQLKREAQQRLLDTNGVATVDGKAWQVRWVHVNPSSYEVNREGYDRMDVKPFKG